jgi:hypothetical protein
MNRRIIRLAVIIFILLVIFGRLHLAFVRYFDSDEMSHMHWAWLVARGNIPYRDFFFYNLPGYQYLISWPFLLPPSSSILILTRIWQFLIYLGAAALLHRITRKLTGSAFTALLSVLIFLTFPMTFDKTIDIRPDISMMFLYMLAVDIIFNNSKWNSWRLIAVGFCVAASVFITLKTVIFALPALAYLYITHKPSPAIKQILVTLTGLIIPAVVFILFLSLTGALPNAITMVARDGFAVSAGKSPFSPWKALSPWPLVYLYSGGDSWPWRVNTAVWILSAIGMILFSLKQFRKSVFLLIFYFFGIAFLFLFPAPFLQYFVPLSVFTGFLAAYSVNNLISAAEKHFPRRKDLIIITITVVLITSLSVSFWQQYRERTSQHSSNSEQLGVITDVLKLTRPDERFYDMVGSYIFRPDGYVICCHPYAEFVDKISIKVPTLRDALVTSGTKFIVMDRTALSFWQPKPDDLFFIRTHYLVSPENWKIYTHGYKFGCLEGICTQYDVENKTVSVSGIDNFRIIADDTYKITVFPSGQTVRIDNTVIGDGISVPLNAGVHFFKADPAVQTFIVQLDR